MSVRYMWEEKGKGGKDEGEGGTDCAPFTPPRCKEVQVEASRVKCEEGQCRKEEERKTWGVSGVRSNMQEKGA